MCDRCTVIVKSQYVFSTFLTEHLEEAAMMVICVNDLPRVDNDQKKIKFLFMNYSDEKQPYKCSQFLLCEIQEFTKTLQPKCYYLEMFPL